MDSLVDQLFSSFGGYGILLIVVLALAVWVMGHVSAQPGTSVSILWGLVTYVKAPAHPKNPKSTEIIPAPESKSLIDHRDQEIYESGKNLVPVNGDKKNEEDTSETDILLSADWLDGANERFEQFTDAQKTKKLENVFEGKTILIEGVVKNVSFSHLSISIGDFNVNVILHGVDSDQMKKLESFHRGDSVRLRASPYDIVTSYGRHTVICKDPFDIERTVT